MGVDYNKIMSYNEWKKRRLDAIRRDFSGGIKVTH